MQRFAAIIALICACTAAAPAEPALAPAQSALIARTAVLTDAVNTYTAHVQADIAMHTFPYLHPQLTGTYYHQAPDKNKVVFTSGLPFMAKEFSRVYPHVPSPSQWMRLYTITVERSADGETVFDLVPRVHSRIGHIDAQIDDRTAELVAVRWNYNDGGYALLKQQYGTVDGHPLVVAQTGRFDVPHYTADLNATFTAFQVNVPIPASVFNT